MQIRNKRDFWSGIMFLTFGVLFMILSRQYQFGTAAKMGPGYFPSVLGGLMAALGLLICLTSTTKSAGTAALSKVGWRELVLVLAAVLSFAMLLPKMGIIVSLVVLIFIAGTASFEFRFRDTLISAIVLLILSYVVFVKGLELQFPLWPAFMTK